MLNDLKTGLIYRNPAPHLKSIHAYFPSVVVLPEGEMIATMVLGEAFEALNLRTCLARSVNNGESWSLEGPLCRGNESRLTSDFARISLLPGGEPIILMARMDRTGCPGEGLSNPETSGFAPTGFLLFRTNDSGRTWSGPAAIVSPLGDVPLELCSPVIPLRDGRCVIPTSPWKTWDGGDSGVSGMITLISHDRCETWPEYGEVMTDPDIDCVVIATRHDTHATFTVEALKQSKDVLVEKPLALSLDELRLVVAAQRSSGRRVLVGFNRRFAPHSQRLREFFAIHTTPLMLIYRVNAGYQSPTNWYQDPIQGGGRIVGEGGHFIDLMSYIVGMLPVQVYALAIPDPALPMPDNVSLIIQFADGSIGTLIYTSGGDLAFSKERLEVFGQGRVGILDDFRSLTLVHRGHKKTYVDRLRQDKGHAAQMDVFVAAVKGDGPWPVSFEDSLITTLVTLLAMESLRDGQPLSVDLAAILTRLET